MKLPIDELRPSLVTTTGELVYGIRRCSSVPVNACRRWMSNVSLGGNQDFQPTSKVFLRPTKGAVLLRANKSHAV